MEVGERDLGGGDQVQLALAGWVLNRSASNFGSWPVPGERLGVDEVRRDAPRGSRARACGGRA